MQNIYKRIESGFEKLTAIATTILGSSITFIMVLLLVIFFLSNQLFHFEGMQHFIRDFIHSITFLSLFVIQKEFNRFSGALYLKINELIVSHKPANNAVLNVELKTEHEITELAKEYTVLARKAK
jgi:low affinity Fe/Cu permease